MSRKAVRAVERIGNQVPSSPARPLPPSSRPRRALRVRRRTAARPFIPRPLPIRISRIPPLRPCSTPARPTRPGTTSLSSSTRTGALRLVRIVHRVGRINREDWLGSWAARGGLRGCIERIRDRLRMSERLRNDSRGRWRFPRRNGVGRLMETRRRLLDSVWLASCRDARRMQ